MLKVMENPSTHTFLKRNQESLNIYQPPSLGQEIDKMGLEYLVMSDNKEFIKNYQVV